MSDEHQTPNNNENTAEPKPAIDQEGPLENTQPEKEEQPAEKHTAVQEHDCKKDDAETRDMAERIAIAMCDLEEFTKAMNEAPNIDVEGSEKGRQWMQALQEAMTLFSRNNVFKGSIERAEALWRQNVEHEGEKLGAAKPRSKSTGGPSQLSGDKAVFKLTDAMGLGTVVQVPLWHTGIWVTLKAPSDGALLELERSIAFEKIELGRHTNGVVFSNSSVYVVNRLVNFVLEHVYDSSLKTTSTKALKREILTTDLPLLVWGIVCAIYPNGYPLSQPCTSDVESCQNVTEEMLNITKLCWTDNNALSGKQKAHMADRSRRFQHEDLVNYQQEHNTPQSRTVNINDAVSVRLSVPTLDMYESAGFKWVDGIVRLVEDSFDQEIKGDDRNRYITEQGMATALRQFSHWVKEITIGEDNVVDRDTIDSLLDRLSSDRDASETLFAEINKLIDDSTLSLVAIPQYQCPKCGGNQAHAHPKYPNLIPLGVAALFFTLLGQRIERMLNP